VSGCDRRGLGEVCTQIMLTNLKRGGGEGREGGVKRQCQTNNKKTVWCLKKNAKAIQPSWPGESNLTRGMRKWKQREGKKVETKPPKAENQEKQKREDNGLN